MPDLPDCSAAVTERSASRPVHPVRVAFKEAGLKLACLLPHTIVGEPDMADARGLLSDLDALIAIIDPVIAAIGHYAESHLGSLDQSLFTDQVLGALDGNATFAIEDVVRKRMEDYGEIAADPRGYAKAVSMEVD